MQTDLEVLVVRDGMEAVETVQQLQRSGYAKSQIYVLAHDKVQTHALVDTAEVNHIDVREQGMLEALANLFRSRGAELRSALQSVGLTREQADRYEEELDKGNILVLARRY